MNPRLRGIGSGTVNPVNAFGELLEFSQTQYGIYETATSRNGIHISISVHHSTDLVQQPFCPNVLEKITGLLEIFLSQGFLTHLHLHFPDVEE